MIKLILCKLTVISILLLYVLLPSVNGEVAGVINYQAYLYDEFSQPVSGTIPMDFTIYDDSIAGSIIWTESHSDVQVNAGHFSVDLGSITPVDNSVFDFTECWLEITVDGEVFSPRTRFLSYPRTAVAMSLNGSSGGDIQGNLSCTGKATFGPGNVNDGEKGFVAGANNTVGETSAVMDARIPCEGDPTFTVICGGVDNVACGGYSAIGGGANNVAAGNYNVISGGANNVTDNEHSTVGGGSDNEALADKALIGGGYDNVINARFSSIVGGYSNEIGSDAEFSYLFGINSTLQADSTFMVDMPHIHFGNSTEGYEFPSSDGSPDQILLTDGAGQLSWNDPPNSQNSGWTDLGTSVCLVTETDDVGVGTADPVTALQLFDGGYKVGPDALDNDDISICGESSVLGLFSKDAGTSSGALTFGQVDADNIYQNKWAIDRTTQGNACKLRFSFGLDNSINSLAHLMVIDSTGRVGIGTQSPASDLHVVGKIKSSEGFMFPDGSVQNFAADDLKWKLKSSRLETLSYHGLMRGEANNIFYGDSTRTMINFGEDCTVGAEGQNYYHCNVYGGHSNVVEGNYSAIINGENNEVSSEDGIILGGNDNILKEPGLMIGWSATIDQYTWSPVVSIGQWAEFYDLVINYGGDIYGNIHVGTVGENNGGGAHLSGSGTWYDGEGSPKEKGISSVDCDEILEKISTLKFERWQLSDSSEVHIGPDSRDFALAFNLGSAYDDASRATEYISAHDMAGVALAGIIGLNKRYAKIDDLDERVDRMLKIAEEMLKNEDGNQ